MLMLDDFMHAPCMQSCIAASLSGARRAVALTQPAASAHLFAALLQLGPELGKSRLELAKVVLRRLVLLRPAHLKLNLRDPTRTNECKCRS